MLWNAWELQGVPELLRNAAPPFLFLPPHKHQGTESDAAGSFWATITTLQSKRQSSSPGCPRNFLPRRCRSGQLPTIKAFMASHYQPRTPGFQAQLCRRLPGWFSSYGLYSHRGWEPVSRTLFQVLHKPRAKSQPLAQRASRLRTRQEEQLERGRGGGNKETMVSCSPAAGRGGMGGGAYKQSEHFAGSQQGFFGFALKLFFFLDFVFRSLASARWLSVSSSIKRRSCWRGWGGRV